MSKLIDLTGLTTFAAKIKAYIDGKITTINTALGTKLEDSSKDGSKYARQDGSWVKIQEGSQITVDEAMSSSSTNPVQNKVVNTALETLNTTLSGAITTTSDAVGTLSTKVDNLDYTVATEAEINALFD